MREHHCRWWPLNTDIIWLVDFVCWWRTDCASKHGVQVHSVHIWACSIVWTNGCICVFPSFPDCYCIYGQPHMFGRIIHVALVVFLIAVVRDVNLMWRIPGAVVHIPYLYRCSCTYSLLLIIGQSVWWNPGWKLNTRLTVIAGKNECALYCSNSSKLISC